MDYGGESLQASVEVAVNPEATSEVEVSRYDFSDLMGRLSWQGDPSCSAVFQS
jgi:hypothetical protein